MLRVISVFECFMFAIVGWSLFHLSTIVPLSTPILGLMITL